MKNYNSDFKCKTLNQPTGVFDRVAVNQLFLTGLGEGVCTGYRTGLQDRPHLTHNLSERLTASSDPWDTLMTQDSADAHHSIATLRLKDSQQTGFIFDKWTKPFISWDASQPLMSGTKSLQGRVNHSTRRTGAGQSSDSHPFCVYINHHGKWACVGACGRAH